MDKVILIPNVPLFSCKSSFASCLWIHTFYWIQTGSTCSNAKNGKWNTLTLIILYYFCIFCNYREHWDLWHDVSRLSYYLIKSLSKSYLFVSRFCFYLFITCINKLCNIVFVVNSNIVYIVSKVWIPCSFFLQNLFKLSSKCAVSWEITNDITLHKLIIKQNCWKMKHISICNSYFWTYFIRKKF